MMAAMIFGARPPVEEDSSDEKEEVKKAPTPEPVPQVKEEPKPRE